MEKLIEERDSIINNYENKFDQLGEVLQENEISISNM